MGAFAKGSLWSEFVGGGTKLSLGFIIGGGAIGVIEEIEDCDWVGLVVFEGRAGGVMKGCWVGLVVGLGGSVGTFVDCWGWAREIWGVWEGVCTEKKLSGNTWVDGFGGAWTGNFGGREGGILEVVLLVFSIEACGSTGGGLELERCFGGRGGGTFKVLLSTEVWGSTLDFGGKGGEVEDPTESFKLNKSVET